MLEYRQEPILIPLYVDPNAWDASSIILKPSEILNELTNHVINSTSAGADVKDGMDIAMCCLDTETKILEYAGAYNPLYILRNNEIQITKATKHYFLKK